MSPLTILLWGLAYNTAFVYAMWKLVEALT